MIIDLELPIATGPIRIRLVLSVPVLDRGYQFLWHGVHEGFCDNEVLCAHNNHVARSLDGGDTWEIFEIEAFKGMRIWNAFPLGYPPESE